MASRLALAAFVVCLSFHFWGALVGWESKSLPGMEFRQAQTALSAFFIKQENNFSPAYPTPVLGKPWSIPMEFPLYQWTVVGLGKVTGLGLTKSGRLVSLICFYLTLPAIFLLLGTWGVAIGRRWLVLAVVVTCPFYIFYSRAFLIETMALMFSVWFWVGFRFAVERRNWGWLALAVIAGVGAGLVKVTTFAVYLLPAAGWALLRLWRGRREMHWREDIAWMAGAVVPSLLLAFWWIRFADTTKAANPAADFLLSGNLIGWNLGSVDDRLSARIWLLKWKIVTGDLSWLPILGAGAVLAFIGKRHRWLEIGLCLSVFVAALVMFPVLYAYHDYYYVANGVLLMVAVGMTLVGLAESGAGTWLVMICLAGICGGQTWRYFQHYYEEQSAIRPGGDALSMALKNLTEPGDVLLVLNQDWNSMLPYYAQRRALMIREMTERNEAQVTAALAALAGEKIGALVVAEKVWEHAELIRRGAGFGLETHPAFFSCGFAVFLPEARHQANTRRLLSGELREVVPALGISHPAPTTSRWCEWEQLSLADQDIFRFMRPKPVRFYSTFGPNLNLNSGQLRFGAHPVTRLVFQLGAGEHVMQTSVILPLAAYDPVLSDDRATDGVEIILVGLEPDGTRRTLFSRLLNPRQNPADRGLQPLSIKFTLPKDGEIELFFGPGLRNLDARDWICLGELEIRKSI